MKQKQVRSVLSDSAYPLSIQEQKEHASPTLAPYCKTRALAKIFGIPLCQPKEALIKAVERRLFFDSDCVKPERRDLQKHYESEMFSTLKISEDKNDSAVPVPAAASGETEEAKPLSAVFNPEIWTLQKTKLAPEELYKSLGNFTRPNMLFYNYLRNVAPAASLSAIIYLPYVPEMLPSLPDAFIKGFTKSIGLYTQYEEGSQMDILRQKMREIFYLCEDHEDLHLLIPCQSCLKKCPEVASEYCANHMCKICCQSAGQKMPCLIHSDQAETFRYKYCWQSLFFPF